MSAKIQFKKASHEYFLPGKSLIILNEKIILVGGASRIKESNSKRIYEREDYFLEKYKNNRLKIKTKTLQSEDNL